MVECGAVRLLAPPEGPAGWRRVTSAPSAASSLPGNQTNDHQA